MADDRMLTVEEAQEIVLNSVSISGIERKPLHEAQGRVLAENVAPMYDLPPHDNSSVDGYAVRAMDTEGASNDTPRILEVIEEIPAGRIPTGAVSPGTSSRIMTGATLPKGSDAVVMVENTRQEETGIAILKTVEMGQNVRYQGEDIKHGQSILLDGTQIGPGEVGLLAAFQRSQISVRRRPDVAILSTGDEVVEIDEALVPGKIVNTNSYSLAALVRQCNANPVSLNIVRDNEQEIAEAIRSALSADVILSTGGVSVGDYDYVKKVLEDMGAEMKFWRVQMKPGKPLAYGMLQGKPFFGLPGNPVSCMVSFLLFAQPALRKMMGYNRCDWHLPTVSAILENNLSAGGDRRQYLRAKVTYANGRFRVSTVARQGSGMLSSMNGTNGLVIVETGAKSRAPGTDVNVLLMCSTTQAVS
tara:strand:- start:18 stop:1265 length:1248 start_codon:yes stop_codon:yes gene_type:complete